MFGIIGKKSEELPQPPSAQDILEDLDKAGPDDVVFTIDIAQFDLETNPKPGQDFQLKKRFEVIHFIIKVFRIQFFQTWVVMPITISN